MTELNDTKTKNEQNQVRLWRNEIVALLSLGTPMALTQLVQFSINAVDVVMIGQLGPTALAAASLGLVIFYMTWLAGFGPVMAVTPLVSQALGADANDTRDVRRSVRMGLWAIIFAFPIFFGVYFFATDIALALGQPEEVSRLAGPYVLALAPGMVFALAVFLMRNFLAAIERTTFPFIVVIITTLLNAFLNWVFIYGNLGMPRLELIGAGIASSSSHAAGFAILVVYALIERRAKQFEIFKNLFRIDWQRLREVIVLGIPISVTMGFEVFLFNSAVFLMGRIGIDEMAAYQVALNVAAMAFMMPLGFSMAGCVRVGLAAGARDQAGILRASVATIGVCVCAIMLAAIFVLTIPETIAGLYLKKEDADNTVVLGLVASFLPIAGAFMLFDGIQVAVSQVLRGLKDVDLPMIIAGISYWLIGFPLAAWLGLFTPVGAIGIWWGLLAALFCAAIMLSARLVYLIRNPDKQPDVN